MTQTVSNTQSTQFGACEYYSPLAKPHFKWFDSARDEQDFLKSQKYRDEKWQRTNLWCCCACLADLPITLPLGQELVKNLKKDDKVLAASLNKEGETPVISWSEVSLEIAGKTSPEDDLDSDNENSVFISYGQGQNIMVLSNQLLLTSNGKLKPADKLNLSDTLMSKTGLPVPINSIKLGEFTGQKYYVGTGKEYVSTIDEHLLCINDIVIADYILQKNRNELSSDFVEN